MRRQHVLPGNKNNETVHHAIWFDTETVQEYYTERDCRHWLKFGWACYRYRKDADEWSDPEWCRFETIPKFWEFVNAHAKPKKRLYIFCHNTNFDLAVVDAFVMLVLHGWKLRTGIIDGPPTILQYRRRKATILILDTLNIWRVSLADLGQSVGLSKIGMPDPQADQAEWDEYARRDVSIIMKACIEWWAFLIRNDMGGFAPTLAAQSLRTFRHKYMKREIFIDASPTGLRLAREAYHGGRTECFRIGKLDGDFYLLDVNSMYPWVMACRPMPIRIIGSTRYATTADLGKWIKTRSVISRCKIRIDKPAIAINRDGKLIFPIGRFDATLSTPEIRWVLENGTIERVYETASYEQAVVFMEFVTDLYAKRLAALKAGDSVTSEFFKKILNSFYGKWGQRGMNWKYVREAEDTEIKRWIEIDYETQIATHYRQFGGVVQKLLVEGEAYNSHPAIAGHVCAYARIALWEMIEQAGRDNVLYCDTDSLLVTREGLLKLTDRINPGELGYLKAEGSFNHVELYGAKDYVFGNKARIKGIRKNAAIIEPGVYQQERWSSLRGMLREGNMSAPLTRSIRKYLSRAYDKGIVGSDGVVTPYLLS